MYQIGNFFRKIKYVLRWIPKIWKDENWDYTYFWTMMINKLEFDLEYYKRATILQQESYDKIIKEIEFTIKLINRINEDDYYSVADKRLFETPTVYDWIDSKEFPGYKELEGGRSSEEFHEIINLSDKLRDRDFKILNNILKNNLQGWWD